MIAREIIPIREYSISICIFADWILPALTAKEKIDKDNAEALEETLQLNRKLKVSWHK